MTVLIGALTIGVLLSLLALGVYITFRIFAFPDITAEGSITLGACITATLLVTEPTPLRPALVAAVVTGLAVAVGLVWLRLKDGKSLGALISTGLVVGVITAGTLVLILRYRNPVLATLAGFLGGLFAGTVTGVLHTRFKINALLSGILVMTALFSVNLHVLGKSNVSLQTTTTLADYAGDAATAISGGRTLVRLAGWDISTREAAILLLGFVVIVLIGAVLYAFFRTALGTAMRATGDNSQMIRALGVNVNNMMIAGVALSNAFVALAGSLFAQYQGFADVQMGIGMMVWGLASVIIGEALVGGGHLGLALAGAVMGSVLFRLLVAIALRAGLDPIDLKLITAVFVFAALIFPSGVARLKALRRTPANKEKHVVIHAGK
jgi:putative ABC transport system permease protein